MKFAAIFVFALCLALTYAVPKPESQYTTKYDNLNIDDILKNSKLVKAYVNCLVHGKQCTPEGTELRKVLPEALATNCAKCNAKQQNGAINVITQIQKDYPSEWAILKAKWDPTGELVKKLQDAIHSGKITTTASPHKA